MNLQDRFSLFGEIFKNLRKIQRNQRLLYLNTKKVSPIFKLIFIRFRVYKKKVDLQRQVMNQTQLVRSAINVFIVVAVFASLFQQLTHTGSKPSAPPTVTTPSGEQVPLEMTGPKIMGVRIQATDKFHTPLKELLAQNQLNVEISSYEFQGNQYWLNMVFNWGHIALIYILLGKYKSETNESTKKKIMIGGAIAVIGWFFLSAHLKPQRLAIQIQGSKLYDKDQFNDKQVLGLLSEYQFQMQDSRQAAQQKNKPIQKEDAWQASSQTKPVQETPRHETKQEQVFQEQEIF